ncbi:MAG: hypothetical protein R3318_02300, partial [Gammaproteobacteria bacterium]|nr:hypothetical protein [Gammaproteobacteria bacterium]
MLHHSSYFYHVMLDNEILIRVGAFSLWLTVLLFWESLSPRRKTLPHHWLRRINNLALIFVSILIIQVLLPILALLGIAAMAADQSLGIFNTINLPYWLEFLLTIIILDLAIYGQHRLFHKYEILWPVVSGLLVIALGLWVAARGTRDFACRIPNRNVMNRLSRGDIIGTALASMGYALGCTACFGGAIVATLIVYVGGIGSATI